MKKNPKNLGQFFTPDFVSHFMVGLIEENPRSIRILEPCAGKGIFLRALEKRGFKNIHAYEIDRGLENTSSVKIDYQDFLATDPDEKYDVIIGNPPYVRWRNIDPDVRENFRNIEYWKDKINGLGDLLYAFLHLCLDKLREGGQLIFITPMFWTQTLHSSSIRRLFSNSGEMDSIISFNEVKIFKEVSSSIMIFKFVKGRKSSKPIKIANFVRKNKLTEGDLENVTMSLEKLASEDYFNDGNIEAYFQPQFTGGKSWAMIPGEMREDIEKMETACIEAAPYARVNSGKYSLEVKLSRLLTLEDLEEFGIAEEDCQRVRFRNKFYFIWNDGFLSYQDSANSGILSSKKFERFPRLGDIADIANGLVSGLDSAFKAPAGIRLNEVETRCVIPVIKAFQLRKYVATGITPYFFANKYNEEKELKSDCPNIFSHLIHFKKQLESRYPYGQHLPWWHWVFLRNFELISKPNVKILAPCKERIDAKGYVRFALAEGQCYTTQDVTTVVKKEGVKEDVRYILACLNSKLILNWLKFKGLKRGGVLEFSERPLASIPIRLINWNIDQEVRDHERIVFLVDTILENSENLEDHETEIESIISRLYTPKKDIECNLVAGEPY